MKKLSKLSSIFIHHIHLSSSWDFRVYHYYVVIVYSSVSRRSSQLSELVLLIYSSLLSCYRYLRLDICCYLIFRDYCSSHRVVWFLYHRVSSSLCFSFISSSWRWDDVLSMTRFRTIYTVISHFRRFKSVRSPLSVVSSYWILLFIWNNYFSLFEIWIIVMYLRVKVVSFFSQKNRIESMDSIIFLLSALEFFKPLIVFAILSTFISFFSWIDVFVSFTKVFVISSFVTSKWFSLYRLYKNQDLFFFLIMMVVIFVIPV